ncbi:MAG: adenylate kinase [SAR202 cluster bacterium Io17-Chloro-G9]|nr:MAG: adenylate kinase [SAR202 cluster bacterium Io17-Chloro-G9]
MRLVLFGPPGAGKGTQAQLLTDELQVPHISSGDLFRDNLRGKTPLGLQAAEYMNQGLLVPDEVTIDIVLDKVLSLNSQEGFILDGFPRNQHQGEVLEEALQIRSRPLDKVVYIDVPEAELVRRLGGRYSCQECQTPHTVEPGATPGKCQRCSGQLYQRDDDKPDAVHKRIEVYRSETLPVLDFYRQRDLLAEVDGVDTVEAVYKHVLRALDRVSKSKDRE